MIFKNAMSCKSLMKKIADEKNISSQQVLQNYLIEAILQKITKSIYYDKFVIKGGYLLSILIGIDLRTTMDLDTTLQNIEVSKQNLELMFKNILLIDTDESFNFTLKTINKTSDHRNYPGFRVKILARFEQIEENVVIDITVGDVITPAALTIEYNSFISNSDIILLSYPIETILAEKIETILTRGITSTRTRDYYDVYMLSKINHDRINYLVLESALINTLKCRKSGNVLDDYQEILNSIEKSSIQNKNWQNYRERFEYASELEFSEVIQAIYHLIYEIIKYDLSMNFETK